MAVEEEIYDGLDEEPDMLTDEEERQQQRLSNTEQPQPQANDEFKNSLVRSVMDKTSDFVSWAEDRLVPIGSIEIRGQKVEIEFGTPIEKSLYLKRSDDFIDKFITAVEDWRTTAKEQAELYERRFRALDSLNLERPEPEPDNNEPTDENDDDSESEEADEE